MRVVARPDTMETLRERGAVYVWPRALRCCNGRQYVLEAAVERPEGDFDLIHAVEGFQIYARRGLVEPDELHFDLDRRGRVHAFWNGQGWIG
jgi:hypothetical protein